jgi:hypothetical protein
MLGTRTFYLEAPTIGEMEELLEGLLGRANVWDVVSEMEDTAVCRWRCCATGPWLDVSIDGSGFVSCHRLA